MATIYGEQKALLHFPERNRARRKGPNDRRWPSFSAEGIEGVAALEHKQRQRKDAERSQVADWLHNRTVDPSNDGRSAQRCFQSLAVLWLRSANSQWVSHGPAAQHFLGS